MSALVFVISADAYRTRSFAFASGWRHSGTDVQRLLLPVSLWFTLAPLALKTRAAHTTFITLGLYLATALGVQLMTFEDMTCELRVTNRELETAQRELRDLVTTDPLTGCRNRRFFLDVIGREVERR